MKDNGSKVEIARNVQYKQKIDIEDTSVQYVKLSLGFDKPIIMDNTSITLDVALFPSADEVQKFKDKIYTSKQYYAGKIRSFYQNNIDAPTFAWKEGKCAPTALTLINPMSDVEFHQERLRISEKARILIIFHMEHLILILMVIGDLLRKKKLRMLGLCNYYQKDLNR